MSEVEIISPLIHCDADRVCIQFKRVLAECCNCRRAIHGKAHGPLVAYGLFCDVCCPCKTFEPTAAEMELIEANRHLLENVTVRSEEDKRRAATLRQRWKDPVFRAEQEEKRAEAAAKRQAERDRRAAEWKAYEEERETRRAKRSAA